MLPHDEAPAWRWRLASALVVLPFLLLGLLTSVLADRLVFALWGVLAAAGCVALLRWRWPSAGPPLLGAAVACVALTALVARHGAVLDLGWRAALWPLYDVRATRPASAVVLAAALALAAAGVALASWTRRRRLARRPEAR